MQTICVMGGGRWSRVLMTVLDQILSADWQIYWFTRHGWQEAQQWCCRHSAKRIVILREMTATHLSQVDAALVATSPDLHYQAVRRFLELSIPTLCEKPLVLKRDQGLELEQLAINGNCPLGINLELTYASYLEQFLDKIAALSIRQIEILWRDPWSELRYGETKFSDVYTNIIDDMFPHCWSLLRGLSHGRPLRPGRLQYLENSDVRIELSQDPIEVSVTLGRRADQRQRQIKINGGEALLDFSTEPGQIDMAGRKEPLQWQSARPLSRSLQSFIELAQMPTGWMEWPLSVCQCRESFTLSVELAARLWEIQADQLQSSLRSNVQLQPRLEQLILDVFLPLAAGRGLRIGMQDPAIVQGFIHGILQQKSVLLSGSYEDLRF